MVICQLSHLPRYDDVKHLISPPHSDSGSARLTVDETSKYISREGFYDSKVKSLGFNSGKVKLKQKRSDVLKLPIVWLSASRNCSIMRA